MATTSETTTKQPQQPERGGARVSVQKFGSFLSNMIIPNIGAFIAWGLITALFIETGWTPVPAIGGFGETPDGTPNVGLVGPMLNYLLPILIAYTGGKMVYEHRGGVVGAIATIGVIVGAGIPMFIGAMIMGPLGGWSMKKLDALWAERIRPGFELLVNNFSAGIWGMILALLAFLGVAPIVEAFSTLLGRGVGLLVDNGLLPLTSIFIEPAKILFLNNAINHGILTPLGAAEAEETGKSILFLLESNPGPGLGVLLAFSIFGKGMARGSAPGAAIIHFFGGIHEIYFPYVLMKPAMLLAVIGGGMSGVFVNGLFATGLRAPAAPGSIITIFVQAASDSYLGIAIAVVVSTAVSFAIGVAVLRFSNDKGEGDLATATAGMEQMKGKKSSVSSSLIGDGATAANAGPIHRIVFACDAGVGSSAMGATLLRRKVRAAGFADVEVTNQAISNLKDTWDVVVTQEGLTPRARQRTGSAMHVSVENFMDSPRYDEVMELVRERNIEAHSGVRTGQSAGAGPTGDAAVHGSSAGTGGEALAGSDDASVLMASEDSRNMMPIESIVVEGSARSVDAAIDEAGALLVNAGAVDAAYVQGMHDRESSMSTFMGNGLAIPHGTNEAKSSVERSAMSFVRYREPLDWNGNDVRFVIGIAGVNNEHLELLQKVAILFSDPEQVERLQEATSAQDIRAIFSSIGE